MFKKVGLKDSQNSVKGYYLIYTVCFVLMSLLVFCWFIVYKKSLIWNNDGFRQHIKALTYYAEYLRQIVRTLTREGRLVIPEWDFYIGEGSDILQTLHYYVIGDPIAVLSVFIPSDKMHLFYNFASILRIYLAGIAFSALAFGTGLRDRNGILAGALSYCFCYWSLLTICHPYFLNPMIYFPLMILGIEKILRGDKPYLFILSAAVSAASNFYFFYMIVILAVVYALIRLGYLYSAPDKRMEGVRKLLYMGVMAVVGVCMAGAVLFPVIMFFLGDSRMGVKQPFHLFYDLKYYARLPAILLSGSTDKWLLLGVSAPVILACFLLFMKKKEHTFLKLLFVPCIFIILFPVGGSLMNGLSYSANRWSWAAELLCTYVLAAEWEELLAISGKERSKLLVSIGVLFALSVLTVYSRKFIAIAAFPFLLLALYVASRKDGVTAEVEKAGDRTGKKERLMLLITAASILEISVGVYAPRLGAYVNDFVAESEVLTKLEQNEARLIRELSDDPLVRYTGKPTENVNLLEKVSNTQYYWTISNSYNNKFRLAMEMREVRFFAYEGYDDRTALNALAGCSYDARKREETDNLPYGLTEAGGDDIYTVYEYENKLPLGYCYGSCMTEKEWEKLDPVQKQETMLQAACVSEVPEGLAEYTGEIPDYKIPSEISCDSEHFTVTEDGFVTTKKTQKVKLSFKGRPNSETYVRVTGFEFTPTTDWDLYKGDKTADPRDLFSEAKWDNLSIKKKCKIWLRNAFRSYGQRGNLGVESKVIRYIPPDAPFSSGRKDFVVSLGYHEEPLTETTLTVYSRGIYKINSLEIYSVPMDGFAQKITALGSKPLQNIELGEDTVSGDLSLENPGLLCVAIPYTDGWEAYIDGTQTEAVMINQHYVGMQVPAGDHSVKFVYKRPFQFAGNLISLLGFMAFTFIIFYNKKQQN